MENNDDVTLFISILICCLLLGMFFGVEIKSCQDNKEHCSGIQELNE